MRWTHRACGLQPHHNRRGSFSVSLATVVIRRDIFIWGSLRWLGFSPSNRPRWFRLLPTSRASNTFKMLPRNNPHRRLQTRLRVGFKTSRHQTGHEQLRGRDSPGSTKIESSDEPLSTGLNPALLQLRISHTTHLAVQPVSQSTVQPAVCVHPDPCCRVLADRH